jgi:hypothetical protein
MTYSSGRALIIVLCLILSAAATSISAGQKTVPDKITLNDNNSNSPEILPLVVPGVVSLRWTASGDDGNIGTSHHYVIKYSSSMINNSNWAQAIDAPNPPVPLPAGTIQNYTITGLNRGSAYYFAIKSYDEVGNSSEISNICRCFSSGIITPTPKREIVDTLNASAILQADTVVAAHRLLYQFAYDTLSTFATASFASDSLIDSLASVTCTNLRRNKTYYWRLRAIFFDRTDTSLWSQSRNFFMPQVSSGIPLVTLGIPNGGELLSIGAVYNVAWADSDNIAVSAHKLEYSTDGGANWTVIRDWTSGDPHLMAWTVPNTISTQCRIKIWVRDTDNNTSSDISNGNFTIRDNTAPTVRVISPNGGELLGVGAVYNISWADSDNTVIAAHKLEYSTDGGANWTVIRDWTSGDPHLIAWTVPNTISTQCRVKIWVRDADNNTSSDISDGNFTIRDNTAPAVRVISPNGREVWRVSSIHNILWSDGDDAGISAFKIEYYSGNGTNWIIIKDWTGDDPHTFSWTLPNAPAKNCRVRVSVRDSNGNIGTDVSDRTFRIISGASPTDINYPIEGNNIMADSDNHNNKIPDDAPKSHPDGFAVTQVPSDFSLAQSYPNPFNASATIEYGLPMSANVTIDIYDISGRRIANLVDECQAAGYHKIIWNAGMLPSGLYFYNIMAGNFTDTKKMMLLK